jgi:prevent-host-death family protein
MNIVTVSKRRENLGNKLSEVTDDEPIIIQKNNKDVAVLITSRRFKELELIEDLLYKKAADLAFSEGFAFRRRDGKTNGQAGSECLITSYLSRLISR